MESFTLLAAAGLSLACAAALSSMAWPPAAAIADLSLAASGIILMTASRHLLASFRLAEECYD